MLICDDLCCLMGVYVDLAYCANVAALSPPGLNFSNWPPPSETCHFLDTSLYEIAHSQPWGELCRFADLGLPC